MPTVWTWADSPLRLWSKAACNEDVLADLEGRSSNRPVLLRFEKDTTSDAEVVGAESDQGQVVATEERFGTRKAAMARLQRLVGVSRTASAALTEDGPPPRIQPGTLRTFRSSLAVYDGTPPDALIFKGGGTKGIVYAGALKRLEEANLVDKITKLAGTSAGSQVAAMVAFGYGGDELKEIMANAPWDQLLDRPGRFWLDGRNVYSLVKKFGLCQGEFLQRYLDDLFFKKCGRRLCTFSELYEFNQKELRLGACNIVTRKFQFLDRHSHPDMPIAMAARASSSIPLVFKPVAWNDELFVDGGLEGNLPISAFHSGRQTLAFNLVGDSAGSRTERPDGFWSFLNCTMDMLLQASQGQFGINELEGDVGKLDRSGVDVIHISTGDFGALDTDMTPEEIDTLVRNGYTAVQEYLTTR